MRSSSITHNKLPIKDIFGRHISLEESICRAIDNFMDKVEFFKKRQDFRFLIHKTYFKRCLSGNGIRYLRSYYMATPVSALFDTTKKVLSDGVFFCDALMAYCLDVVQFQADQLNQKKRQTEQLTRELKDLKQIGVKN